MGLDEASVYVIVGLTVRPFANELQEQNVHYFKARRILEE